MTQQFDPGFDMEFHEVVHRSRAHLFRGPRRSNLDESVSWTVSQGSERLSGCCRHRAAELDGICASLGERLNEPTPADIVEHRVGYEVRLEGSPDEHDSPERAFPFIYAVRIVEEHEAA